MKFRPCNHSFFLQKKQRLAKKTLLDGRPINLLVNGWKEL